ncbi:hypothetical protein WICPIJ_008189 [Wickerhamomyces pijperi]|uniref:DUF2421 domain-containing protein n=1 Tax=Wickerhamomyces pijperi TaxID=599730 RepID=A0A9P8PYE7_WICPI|nr:hypothetical protein WICPIJ_008189 [Wickerhamomyces pijperi]
MSAMASGSSSLGPNAASTSASTSFAVENGDHLIQPSFQKDDTNLLKKSLLSNPNFSHITQTQPTLLGSASSSYSSALTTAQNPRTSMSQLKLSELQQSNAEQDQTNKEIEDLGLTELRDGFFDPIYNKPRRVNRLCNLDYDQDHDDLFKKSQTTNNKSWVTSLTDQISENFQHYKLNYLIVSKFTISFLITLILSVIKPVSDWFGPYVTFMPMTTLIVHPVHSIGVQCEITIQSILGLALGLGWSSVTLWLSTVSEPVRLHPGGILFGGLSIGLSCMAWIKGAYVRFYYLFLYSGFVLIFTLAGGVDLRQIHDRDGGVNWRRCWDIGIPCLFGLLISLFVSSVYFPLRGDENLMRVLLETTGSVRDLLKEFCTDEQSVEGNAERVTELQKQMVDKTLELAEIFREFLTFMKFSKYSDEDLKSIRNYLNFIVGPLRVIPTPLKIRWRAQGENEYKNSSVSQGNSQPITRSNSGIFTPIPRQHFSPDQYHLKNESNYLKVMDEYFNVPLFQLVHTMIGSIDQLEKSLKKGKSKEGEPAADLEQIKTQLQSRISKIDSAYKKFTRSEYFIKDLLKNESIINIFLFLRYTRQSAVQLVNLIELVTQILQNKSNTLSFYWPNYPLKRSLRRLSKQCLQDQGSDSVYHYFETKLDVDDAFEKIYNLNTSTNQSELKQPSTTESPESTTNQPIHAIDHNDFNIHSTTNPLRLKLWRAIKLINTIETKYSVKVTFGIIFLLLPAWLFESTSWFVQYHCFWAALMFYFLLSPKNSSTWKNLRLRCFSWITGCFLGWLANQPSTSAGRSVLICVIGCSVSVWFSGMLLSGKVGHPRSSLIGLISFTVVALNNWGLVHSEVDGRRSEIWKFSWIDSLAILIGVVSSVLMNWIVWPFYAKLEIFVSVSSLLAHIGQSYQSISERYLYRDLNDDPTNLTLELANIREVRMSQSLRAVKDLLARTSTEMDLVTRFPHDGFERLLESCNLILEKIIEARMAGIYFNVNHQDAQLEKLNKELVTIRRDSVSTVIFIFYILANSFKERHTIPKYLPSTISIRKKLYDLIGEMESTSASNMQDPQIQVLELNNRLKALADSAGKSGRSTKKPGVDKSYIKTYWTEVHGMSFARAYTVIAEELENMILIAKEILGEEDIFD